MGAGRCFVRWHNLLFVNVPVSRSVGKFFFLQPAPNDRPLSHALKIRFFLHLPFTVLLSIATRTFGLIRDGKLKNSKLEGNKDGRDEEGGGRGDVYVIAKPLKEIIDIGKWILGAKGVADRATPNFFFWKNNF